VNDIDTDATDTDDAPVAARGDDAGEEAPSLYSRMVGDRLRHIRKQKGLSLQEVERLSNQEFKASVLGAYERGERAISVPRLHRLAVLYNVPVDQLLPPLAGDEDATIDLSERTAAPTPGTPVSVKIDLTRLEHLSGPEAEMLHRYLSMIQVQRQDFNGRMLTIRRDDLRAIACMLGTGVEAAIERLDDLGLSLTRR
jgi:transcriptional regulator with XRE-family HTH domain